MEQEPKLPLHWSCHFDNFQQSIYYYNENDDVTQWERPYQCETQLSLAEHDPMWYDVKSCRAASQMPQHMLQSAPSSAQSHFIEDNCAFYSDMEVDETIYTSRSNSPEEGHHFSVYRFASSPIEYQTKRDYLEMARLYILQRPYNNGNYNKTCVLCRMNQATHVFFPCEHICVCEGCIENEEICSDSDILSKAHGCCTCPLCAAVIKIIILSDNGNEIEKYWSWIYEFPPCLPENFEKVILLCKICRNRITVFPFNFCIFYSIVVLKSFLPVISISPFFFTKYSV